MASPNTALFVGSPEQIVEKVLRQHELFGHTRFLAQVDIGGLPFDKVAKNIQLLATEVAPQIRKAINEINRRFFQRNGYWQRLGFNNTYRMGLV